MSHITVEHLSKTFHVAQRRPGMLGAAIGLFRRRYVPVRALDDVSFTLEKGELVGYIGPNGAGKSTTIKTLAGILVPDSGHVDVDGLNPWRNRVAHVARIGVVFGQRTQLWFDLPVAESFDLLKEIYRIPPDVYRASRAQLSEMLDIGPLLDTPVRQLSLGQRMRCDIAASLLHRPSILFLDEPTIGLDAVSKLAVREFVLKLNREDGVTVILTTHDMDDIEALCRRIMVIANGRILSDGTLQALRASVSAERWLTIDLAEGAEGGGGGEVTDPDARLVRRDGARVVLAFDPARVAPAAIISRICAAHPVRDLFVENPPIETIIARLYERFTPERLTPGEGR